jgi:hypothetical protein
VRERKLVDVLVVVLLKTRRALELDATVAEQDASVAHGLERRPWNMTGTDVAQDVEIAAGTDWRSGLLGTFGHSSRYSRFGGARELKEVLWLRY